MNYILKTLPVGLIEANCYIFGCAKTRTAVIIDPGAQEGIIKKQIEGDALKPECIINTHGHGDHIGANSKFGLPVFIHKADAVWLTKPAKNISAMLGIPVSSPPASRLLEDGDRISIGELYLEVIHTPGHSQGSICLRWENILFTGDTLFAEGVGRTDWPGGSEAELIKSIKEKLFILPDETKVYPGHGPATTIGYEKEHNPFI